MEQKRPSRKDARALREASKKLQAEDKRARLLAPLPEVSAVRLSVSVPDVKTAHRISASPGPSSRQPRMGANPNTIYDLHMTWCISQSDRNGAWGWGEDRTWSDIEWSDRISSTLTLLQNNTWGEIERMRAGDQRRLAYHHGQAVESLHDEAQDRWIELKIESDEAFRFRLGNTKRAWGYREGAHFYLVWYERGHNICKVEQRNT